MADTKIEIKVGASTGAAQEEFSKLTAKVRENTEAADAAGKGQQGLAKQLGNTKAAQIEASEAVRRAKSAQEEHNLTVGAFGPKSAQAKASADQLAKATKAQAEATEKAAKSLDKTTKAVVDAAKAEGDQLSPATIRATKQVEDLGKAAEKSAQDMRKTELASKQQAKSFDVMGFAGGKLMGILGPAALGGSLIALGGWLGEASEKTLQYETTLANLPFSLEAAQKATRGLVSESQLASAASAAMSLGVVKSEAEFSKFAESATKLALKNGVSTGQMISDLTTAVGRGSVEILDNASIIVKAADANEVYAQSVGKTVAELTDAEKKGALQAAMMKAIGDAAADIKVEFDGNAAAIQKLKVSMGDLWDTMERGTVNAFGSVINSVTSFDDELVKMQASVDLMNREMMRAQGWSQGFKDISVAAGEMAVNVLAGQGAYEKFAEILSDPNTYKEVQSGLDLEEKRLEVLTEEEKVMARVARVQKRLADENEKRLDQMAYEALGGTQGIKKEKAPKKKKEKVDKDLELVKKTNVIHDESDLIGEMFAADQQLVDDAMIKSFERQQTITDQEIELAEARGLAHESLIDRRMNQEMAFARWQVQNAKTDKAREEAQTRVETIEHKKRLVAAQRAQKAEEAEAAKKMAMFEKVNAHVQGLGESLVSALWAQAEGEKGAAAAGVAAYAKGVSQKMALKALEETALGVAALAGIYTAALAPPHFAAAALAAGAAAAAGGVAVGFGALAKSQRGDGGAAKAPSAPTGTGGGISPRSGSSSGEGGDDDGIPTSYVERSNFSKRNQPTNVKREGGGNVTNINVNNPQFLGSTPEQVGIGLKRMMDNAQKSAGKTR